MRHAFMGAKILSVSRRVTLDMLSEEMRTDERDTTVLRSYGGHVGSINAYTLTCVHLFV